jgi:hypothetical protein
VLRKARAYRVIFHEQVLEIVKATSRSMRLVFTQVPVAIFKC